MSRPIKIQQPVPKADKFTICPCGLYCNKPLQTAKIGDVVQIQTSWRKDKRVITNICRFRINTPEFTFMLRSIYGENMTIGKLMERWEAWAIVEGIGKEGFSRDEALLLETRSYDAELAEMETKKREAYRKDNDMNEFDKRAEAYMRTVMNNDGDVFTRADLYEYIMDAWKAGYAEVGFDLSLLSGESLSKAQNQKSQPIN